MALSTVLKNANGNNFPHDVAHIVFTDQLPPLDVELQDMSEAEDGGVVGWTQDDTYYISTLRLGVKVTAPENCFHLFYGGDNLDNSHVQTIDATMLDTSSVTNMCRMFSACYNLYVLTGFNTWNTSAVTNMNTMFDGCVSLENVDVLANWDVSNVADMSCMFCNCKSLKNIDSLANWNTSAVTDMSGMFAGCARLSDVTPLADWDTSKVTDISDMFNSCKSLENINGLAEWDTHNVTDMEWTFANCPIANIAVLANWDTGSVTNMSQMFYGCTSLPQESIDFFNHFHATPKPYVPKSPATDKAPDTEPER
jgi:surface protein